MARFSRTVYALFLFSAVLARPLTLATGSQAETLTNHTGQGTHFDPGLGACGYVDSSSDPVVAIASSQFGAGGNCNQWVKITNTANGKSTYGKTRDSCPDCSSGDLDMSSTVFKEIGSLSSGIIPIRWSFQPKGWNP